MIAAKNLLDSLANDGTQERKDHNDDYDFSKVLEFCGGDTIPKHKIRYSNGQEEVFSFDGQK